MAEVNGWSSIAAPVLDRKERSTMTADSEHRDESAVELRLTPWAYPGEAKLHVRAEDEQQLRELLTSAGIKNSRIHEFHYEPILTAVAIGVGSAAAWKALASVVTAFLDRNKHKTIKVTLDGEPVELAGFSTREVDHLIDRMAQLHQDKEQWWQEFTGRGDQAAGEVEPES
jgi:hypothetical protein